MPASTTPNLQRVRYAVRGVLVLGMAASVAANVLHAEPNPISKVIAAWPPIALLLAIELVTHVPVHRLAVTRLRRVGTLVIAGIAAYVSYWHMAGVAERYGESGLSVYLLPLSVDGLIAVASICLVELSGRMRRESSSEGEGAVPDAVADTGPDKAKPRQARRTAGSNTPIVAESAPRPARDKPGQSVAASVEAAAGRVGRDVDTVWQEVQRTTHPGVSRDTVRKSLSRLPTNGHVAGVQA